MRECWAVEKMAPKTGEWVTLIVYRSEMAAAIARAGMSKSAEYRVVRYVPADTVAQVVREEA